jgi:hypothetical protein
MACRSAIAARLAVSSIAAYRTTHKGSVVDD